MLYSDNNPIVSFTVIAHFSLWSIRTSLRSTCLTSPSVCFLPPLICLHGDKLRHWCNRTDRGSARMCLSARMNHSVVQPATQQQTAGEKPCRETREPTWPWYRNDWMMHIYKYSHLQAVCCFLGWSTSCLIDGKGGKRSYVFPKQILQSRNTSNRRFLILLQAEKASGWISFIRSHVFVIQPSSANIQTVGYDSL